MVLLLRHSDQVFRVRTSSTCECDGQFTPAKSLSFGGFKLAHRPLWPLATSGLPLSSASPECSGTSGGSRSQAGLYRQAVHFFDPTSPPASPARRWGHQPVGGIGAEALLEIASRSWLSAKTSARFVAKTNMCMIVCRRKKCRRFITGWSPMGPRANRPPN
jgi:hypothetical protein